MNFSKKATELRLDHTAAWELLWISSISAEHLFGRHISRTASISLTQDFLSPIRCRLPYDLCVIAEFEAITFMITAEMTSI